MTAAAVGAGFRAEVAQDIHDIASSSSECVEKVFEDQQCNLVDSLRDSDLSTSVVLALAGGAISAAGISIASQSRRANIFQPTHNGFKR